MSLLLKCSCRQFWRVCRRWKVQRIEAACTWLCAHQSYGCVCVSMCTLTEQWKGSGSIFLAKHKDNEVKRHFTESRWDHLFIQGVAGDAALRAAARRPVPAERPPSRRASAHTECVSINIYPPPMTSAGCLLSDFHDGFQPVFMQMAAAWVVALNTSRIYYIAV